MVLEERKAIIVDAAGLVLDKDERKLFADLKPAGFILFQRNCASKAQVSELILSMRECVGDYSLPVLIDQEGGPVARLKSPAFREYPAARHFDKLAREEGMAQAISAVRENFFEMGCELADMGITINCAPVLDVPSAQCHPFLAEQRVYGDTADDIAALGRAVCEGLLEAGISPVIKHIPGHGRAEVDSHFGLPVVGASQSEMAETDFKPFKALSNSDMKIALWAMAAHVVYSALDPDSAATTSRKITDDVIRGVLGFEGVLIADDVSMQALGGTVRERVEKTMAAGMDLTMLCNASFEDRKEALEAAPAISPESAQRIRAADQARKTYIKGHLNEQVSAATTSRV